MPSIRSRMPALAGIFAATVLLALAGSIGILAATRSLLHPGLVGLWIFVSLGVGCLAVLIAIHFLFQRPLVEAWALGGVRPERRQTVREAVWHNTPETLDPLEADHAASYARIFTGNTPHRMLQWTIGFIGILFLLAGILFLGLDRVSPFSALYLVITGVSYTTNFRKRKRQTRGAEAFLQRAAPGATPSTGTPTS